MKEDLSLFTFGIGAMCFVVFVTASGCGGPCREQSAQTGPILPAGPAEGSLHGGRPHRGSRSPAARC